MESSDLVRLLGQKYTPEILEVTDKAKSAEEISNEAEVPIGTTYRRINDLTETDLLKKEDEILTEERRRRNVYRRNIDEIKIEFTSDSMSVSVEERSDVKNRLEQAWRRLSDQP